MESMMAVNVANHSPEISGLSAAKSGLALVEAAFGPVSLRIRPASLWFVAVISLGALATAAGVMVAGDLPTMTAAAEAPAAAEAVSPVPAPAAAEVVSPVPASSTAGPTASPTASTKHLSVQPVGLRGEP